jgi:hypothetical protein
MQKIWRLCLPLLLILPGQAFAHSKQPGHVSAKASKHAKHKRIKVAKASSGEPVARIRGQNDATGLAPLAFGQWLAAHSRFALPGHSSFRLTSSPTRLLNRTSTYFAMADADGDGRVSATELADFLSPSMSNRALAWRV